MNFPKKLTSLALAALMVFSLAACGGQPAPAETAEPTETATAAPAQTEKLTREVSGPFSPDGSVIFDKDGVKVTTAGLDADPTTADDDLIIWLDIENTGDKDAYLGVTGGSVNGFMATVVLIEFYDEETDGYFGSSSGFDAVVPAGETVRRALGYYKALSRNNV